MKNLADNHYIQDFRRSEKISQQSAQRRKHFVQFLLRSTFQRSDWAH